MRRSKAPSVQSKSKRLHNSNIETEGPQCNKNLCSDPEDEQYSWGSRNCNLKQSKYENKRVFCVVWRDVSTKKHKIWKGDGTLEVNTVFPKAILKDEAGKYIGCSTKFNRNDLVPDFSMVIGGKEIEIQEELTEDQFREIRKRRYENRLEEYVSSEDKTQEQKERKGGFTFKPILVLKAPKILNGVENFKDENLNYKLITDETKKTNSQSQKSCLLSSKLTTPVFQNYLNIEFCREFICFLRPSELQQLLFQKSLEYISYKHNSIFDQIQSLEIYPVLQCVCNHPSLINKDKDSTNNLIHHLLPNLPDWTEMGPFDSCKLEFVQYFLTDIKKLDSQVCAIIAKNISVLNMLQGLCDFINIRCLRIEDIEVETITKFCVSDNYSARVLLVNSEKMLSNNFFFYCENVIIFEDVSRNLKMGRPVNAKNTKIYNLITAFSIEELLLLDACNDNMQNFLDELNSVTATSNDCCYLHSKMECNCFKSTLESKSRNNIFEKNWYHFKSPFDAKLLKVWSLENSSENIISIFCKKISTI